MKAVDLEKLLDFTAVLALPHRNSEFRIPNSEFVFPPQYRITFRINPSPQPTSSRLPSQIA